MALNEGEHPGRWNGTVLTHSTEGLRVYSPLTTPGRTGVLQSTVLRERTQVFLNCGGVGITPAIPAWSV